MSFLEVKRHLNKPDDTYACELLARGPGHVVLRYVSDRPARVGAVAFEAGSTTYASYREGAGYVLWRMCGPDGRLRGHLFHVCRELRVEAGRVEYLDLLLDLWFDPDSALTVLDRQEVAACRQAGLLDETDLAWISAQEREIVREAERITGELDALLQARHIPWPGDPERRPRWPDG